MKLVMQDLLRMDRFFLWLKIVICSHFYFFNPQKLKYNFGMYDLENIYLIYVVNICNTRHFELKRMHLVMSFDTS